MMNVERNIWLSMGFWGGSIGFVRVCNFSAVLILSYYFRYERGDRSE